MSDQHMLLKVNTRLARVELAAKFGAKRILIPSVNKRGLAEVPEKVLTAIQRQFYDYPVIAAILATGMG